MIKAKHNFFIYLFIIFYSFWKIKKHFHHVDITNKVHDFKQETPILLIGNHISWWDGFIAQYLNQTLWKKQFHFMMLEEQLLKNRFLNFTGGFSIAKKSKDIIESLVYAQSLLQKKENLVLVFPQGKINSIHQQQIVFEKGIERIIPSNGAVNIVFMVNLIDYFSEQKPCLHCYLCNYESNDTSHQELQKAFQSFYTKCLENQYQLAT